MIGCGRKIWHEIEKRQTICNHDHLCDDCCNKLNGVECTTGEEVRDGS